MSTILWTGIKLKSSTLLNIRKRCNPPIPFVTWLPRGVFGREHHACAYYALFGVRCMPVGGGQDLELFASSASERRL
ncbi:unnamed protein product [Laminaria digitata]